MRLVHPQAFAAVLRQIGTPTDRLFRRVGLPVHCDDPSAFVPLRQAWALFDAAAQAEDPMLAWHVGRFHGDNHLGRGLLERLENAPTLYQALYRLVRLISAEASHLQLRIVERRDDILFSTQYSRLKDWPGYYSSQAYQLEVYLDVIRHYLGRQWVPSEVGIEYPTVPAIVKEHFAGARIRPNQRAGYIAVPRSSLHVSAPGVEPRDRDGDRIVLAGEFDFVDTLEAMLRAYMTDGYPSARKTAALMDTSVRTLARRLAARGTSYRRLVDEVRFRRAKRLLRESPLRIIDVAGSVGFQDPAHFSRMFRRLGGLTPRQFRRSIGTLAKGQRSAASYG